MHGETVKKKFLLYVYTHTHVVDHVLNSDLHKIQLAPGLQEADCCVHRGVSIMLLNLCDFHENRRREGRTFCELHKITFTLAE